MASNEFFSVQCPFFFCFFQNPGPYGYQHVFPFSQQSTFSYLSAIVVNDTSSGGFRAMWGSNQMSFVCCLIVNHPSIFLPQYSFVIWICVRFSFFKRCEHFKVWITISPCCTSSMCELIGCVSSSIVSMGFSIMKYRL